MVLNRSNHKSVNVVVWLLLRPEKEIMSDSAFDFSQSLTTVKRDTDISFLRAKKSQQKNILIFLRSLNSFCWLPFNLGRQLDKGI